MGCVGINVIKFKTLRDDVEELRDTKEGESDVTSRTLSTRKQFVISNLSGKVNVLNFQSARDDVVEMREKKDGEIDVTSRTLSTRKQSVISNLSGIVKCS